MLVCLFLLGFGSYLIWKSEVGLPAAYASLRSSGVRATADLVRCARGLNGGRGVACELALDFDGYTRTWVYLEDSSQFNGFLPGEPVAVVVDPNNPRTVYTVRDVEQGTNAGLRSPLLWYGVVLIVFGLAGFAIFLWLTHRLRRSFPESG